MAAPVSSLARDDQYETLRLATIPSNDGFPEPRQQRQTHSAFRDTKSQLVRTNAQFSRHGFGKAFRFALDEPVIAQVAAGYFEPEP